MNIQTELRTIPLDLLVNNTGQVEGVRANPRLIKDEDYKKLKKSLRESDLTDIIPLKVLPIEDGKFMTIGGNMRLRALQELGVKETRCVVIPKDTPAEVLNKAIILDNSTHGEWDFDMLANEWTDEPLEEWGVEIPKNIFGSYTEKSGISLSDRFIVPPFTILDTRQGYWRERKEYWNAQINDECESREYLIGQAGTIMSGIHNGTSLLDPVLAEIIVSWFGIENGNAFDCFSGDTAFGYVSTSKGMLFTGIDIREEQVRYNQQRVPEAKYICADGQNVGEYIKRESQDLLFSCPPYYDLEVYSELPNDASNQETYEDFLQIISNAFSAAIDCLKNDRFAVVVCGDIRDKRGYYRGFPEDIVQIFTRRGMPLYNRLVLVENIGTAVLRAANCMKNRKVVKTHQDVLVFYKGNLNNIKNNYKEISYGSEDLEQFRMGED